jgi:hypothetical protein
LLDALARAYIAAGSTESALALQAQLADMGYQAPDYLRYLQTSAPR